MPVKRNKLPRREVEIGKRLRVFRESIKWSQSEFAQAVGISRDQLAGVEYGRTPLRYHLGNRICFIMQINQRWLAVGSPPMGTYLVLRDDLHRATDTTPLVLFSEVYDEHLAAFMDQACASLSETTASEFYRQLVQVRAQRNSPPTMGDMTPRSTRSVATAELVHSMWEWLRDVPDDNAEHFRSALRNFITEYVRKHGPPKSR